MTGRRCLVALAAVAVCAGAVGGAPAGAQLQLGGSVPDLLALSVGQPGVFRKLRGSDVYELRIRVRVSATGDLSSLGVADGEDFRPPARGRLRVAGRLVSAPLEVSVAGGAAQSLGATDEPILKTWHRAVTLTPATIVLDQRLPQSDGAARALHKLILITLSPQAP